MRSAADLGVPPQFNAATYFVDRHIDEGRGAKIAIECGDERVTYAQLQERVNRFGSALKSKFGVQRGERVALLLLDGPAFFYAFFGAIKIGAVPIPTNTLWRAADYKYLLNDSAARVLIISEQLRAEFEKIPREQIPALEHVITDVGAVLEAGRPGLEPEGTGRDDPAFWLYSSGSTGSPKGCVHLQRDMVVCAELFGKRVLGITESD